MSAREIDPKFMEVARGKRVVILDEDEYDLLLDAYELSRAERVLEDKGDEIVDWRDATQVLVTNRIAEARRSRKISQRELARRLGIAPSTLSRQERPDANLTLGSLRAIAGCLGCSIHDLIE
jgi:DNA-binding Xre family transcriptional regulator